MAIDAETMSMDELRKAAEAEALAASKTPEQIEAEKKAADEQAVVDKAEQERVAAEEAAKKTPKTFYRERTIDLGDGAGVQVFKGKGATSEDALEDLTDRLAEAQRNATKKIRELNAKVKPEVRATPEDDALLAAELLKAPSSALDNYFKSKGFDIEETKKRNAEVAAEQETKKRQRIGNEFVASHPDFADTPHNANLINKWLALHNDFSSDSFEKAYQDLNESGLLDVKGEEASAEQKAADAEAQRIAAAAKEASSLRTRKASGLSTQRRSAVPPPTEPTEAELYKMPMDELRRLANKQLAT